MIHTYLFIYSFNIAVAVAVVSFGAVSQEYGSSRSCSCSRSAAAAGLRPTARLSECCRSLLSLALGMSTVDTSQNRVQRDRIFFSSSISLAADRPARAPAVPAHRTALPPVRSPIRSRCARVNPPLGERESV
ncbi:hypothetical protein EVAR_91030_1 [Eumeta japonica]|uniref:Uncharacterized protein n=1 Tax=Eumeta variegata TaxID=151549 RepID=A0A4C1T1H9_EUMVA|nr:hypothetical protein EVAR_91030_1 [Eumeta japonica]